MSPTPSKNKSTPPVTCRRCQSTELHVMGRMDASQETLCRCARCGLVFTTAATTSRPS